MATATRKPRDSKPRDTGTAADSGAAGTGRTGLSRAVTWTGLALGTAATVLAVMNGVRVPRLETVLSVLATWALLALLAIAVVGLLRRHHRAIAGHAARHGKRGALAAARGTRRGTRSATAWLAAKAAARWENRERRPLMFRKLRGEPEDAGYPECWLCGFPLGEDAAGAAHDRCLEAYERDCAKWEIRDNRELDVVEDDLRRKERCPRQIKPGDPGGSAIYCGQPIEDSGADEPDQFCPQHQLEHDGDGDGAAEELNEHVRNLLQEAGNPATKGSTTMTASKITPDRRARRTAARTGGSIPSEWGPVVAQAADFEPESDGHLLDWMAGQVTGMAGYAEALIEAYETGVGAVGIDPKGLAALHDVADAAAHAAEAMAAAKQKFTDHYELPREFAANGGLMTHDGRWVTGEGA
jgi:hypothetical protein